MSPALIVSVQQRLIVSVAFAFVRVPDLEIVVLVVLSWSCATAGSTVPAGAAIVIMSDAPRPPFGMLVTNENEYLTCWMPPALDDSVTALSDWTELACAAAGASIAAPTRRVASSAIRCFTAPSYMPQKGRAIAFYATRPELPPSASTDQAASEWTADGG